MTRPFVLPMLLYVEKVQRRIVIFRYLDKQHFIYGNLLVTLAQS